MQLGDFGGLVGGKHLGDDLIDAELRSHPFCGGPAVAGEHDRPHPQFFECDDRFGGGLTRCVCDGDDGRGLAVERDLDARAALAGELFRARSQPVAGDALTLKQPRVADGEPVAVDGGEQPVAGHRLERFGAWRLEPALGGRLDDGLGEWVLAVALGGRHEA